MNTNAIAGTWQYPLRAAVLLCLSFALFLYPWTFGVYGGVNVADIAKAVAIVLAVPLVLAQSGRWGFGSPSLHALLFLAWAALRLVDVPYERAGYSSVKDYVLVMLCFVVIGESGFGKWSIQLMIWALSAGGVLAVSMLMAGMELKGGAEFLRSTERYGIEGLNANYTAYACSAAAALVAAIWVSKGYKGTRSLIGKLLHAGILVTLGVGVLIPATRGAFLSLASVFLALLIVTALKRNMGGLVVAVGGIVASGFVLAAIPIILDRFTSRVRNWDSSRWGMWSAAWDAFAGSPILGVGPGQFPMMNGIGISPHNGCLSLLAELGFPGFFFYMMAILMTMRQALRSRQMGPVLIVTAAWLPVFMTGVWERSFVGLAGFGVVLAMARDYDPDTEQQLVYRAAALEPMPYGS